MTSDQFEEAVPAQDITTWFADATDDWHDGIQIDSCDELDLIEVKTRHSTYWLIVLSGNDGEVLVRGGHHFPEFQRVRLVGASLGGSCVKVCAIYAGLCMELRNGPQTILTSPVVSVQRRASVSRDYADVSSASGTRDDVHERPSIG